MSPNFASRTVWTGDNLDILRGLNSACIDLIYLDPPFNSNRAYEAPIGSRAAGAAFKDSWSLSDLDVAWMGLIADEQPALAHTLKAAGFSHGRGMQSYLTMMSVRLLELHRVLKDTGSIYLHCDPTASHYLKQLMDAIFGAGNFRNEIIWQRYSGRSKGSQHAPKTYGVHHDTLLFYSGGEAARLHPYRPATPKELASRFPKRDSSGRHYTRIAHFCGANMGDRPNLCYTWRGFTNPHPSGWRVSKERLQREYDQGKVVIRPDGSLERRRYYDPNRGIKLGNVWTDIQPPKQTELTGYPTQKPLALLERIIKASSNQGDWILDPFCGCATACVAAEKLGRRWVGVDISAKAIELVHARLAEPPPLGMGSLFHNRQVTARTDVPQRTDVDAPRNYRQNKHVLFGQQEGLCAGCRRDFPFRNFTIDHKTPRSRGGTDHLGNLQLLCGACNSLKGDRDQAYLVAQLQQRGVLAEGRS